MAATSATDVSRYLAERRQEVDDELSRLLPPESAWPQRLHRAIRHSLFAGGKRLRPVLVISGAEAVGGTATSAIVGGADR